MIKWEDIGGLEEVKHELKETVQLPFQNPHHYLRFTLELSGSIRFNCSPGC
jgi:transitional endoplasmic reticulum ATPase